MGFLFSRLGHAPGVGLVGTVGGWRGKKFFSEIQPDLGPWGGAKSQISFNLNYKVNFKDF